MIIIVDANILISGIINPHGTIKSLLLNNNPSITLIIPDFAIIELKLHKNKICKTALIYPAVFDNLLIRYLKNITQFSHESINISDYYKAEKLVTSIDNNDVWYIALSLSIDALLWTGNLKLFKGLRKAGFNNIITTHEFVQIIKGIY